MYRVKRQIGYEGIKENKNGEGITVAILDTGISMHPDFDNRIIAFKDFVNQKRTIYDDSSHGTHVAGIIAGSGIASNGTIAGMAQKCQLVIGKVLDKNGEGEISHMIEAIDWIISNMIKWKIRILNISIGLGRIGDEELEKKAMFAIEKAWNAGLVVVVAAGNGGPDPMSISPIGATEYAITVGCNEGGFFGKNKNLCENYSGRGPTRYSLKKPDIVAPGTDIISCNSLFKKTAGTYRNAYIKKSGTSMAAPIVSGTCALLLSHKPQLTNNEIKRKLRHTALDLHENWSKQGAGMIQVGKLINSP